MKQQALWMRGRWWMLSTLASAKPSAQSFTVSVSSVTEIIKTPKKNPTNPPKNKPGITWKQHRHHSDLKLIHLISMHALGIFGSAWNSQELDSTILLMGPIQIRIFCCSKLYILSFCSLFLNFYQWL